MGQKTVGFFQILFIFHLITHSGLCFLSSQYRIANSRPVKSNYHDHHFNIYASPLNENFNDVQSLNNTLSDTKSSLVGTNITLVVNSNEEEEEEDLDNEFYMPGLFGTSESKSIYPYSMSSQKVERHLPSDFSFKDLKVDDPLFLDMPWPTEASEESSAFARHFQWKRKLSDGERNNYYHYYIFLCSRSKIFLSLITYVINYYYYDYYYKRLKVAEVGNISEINDKKQFSIFD